MFTAGWVSVAFLFGSAVGSFLNVLIVRGRAGEPPTGRSRCRSCRTTLSAKELVPLLSFFVQKVRCLHCGTALSRQYPIVEAGTAVIFGITAWLLFNDFPPHGRSLIQAIILLPVLSAAIVILVSDIRFRIIPNGAVLTLFLAGIVVALFRSVLPSDTDILSVLDIPTLARDLAAAAGAAALLAFFWFISKGRWMGFGDVKLIGATSLLLGFPASVAAFLFSFWTGGLYGIALLAARRATMASKIPFGPFILTGALLAYFFTDLLLHKFLKFPYL